MSGFALVATEQIVHPKGFKSSFYQGHWATYGSTTLFSTRMDTGDQTTILQRSLVHFHCGTRGNMSSSYLRISNDSCLNSSLCNRIQQVRLSHCFVDTGNRLPTSQSPEPPPQIEPPCCNLKPNPENPEPPLFAPSTKLKPHWLPVPHTHLEAKNVHRSPR